MEECKKDSFNANNGRKRAMSGSILYMFQAIISSLLPLISIPIVTHHLEPSQYGIFALAQVYATIAIGMVNFGVISGYERNFFLFQDDTHKTNILLHSVTAFVGLNIIMLSITVWFWKSSLSRLLFEMDGYGDLLLIIVVGSGLSSLTTYYLTYLKNKSYVSDYIKIVLFQSILNFTGIIIFLLYFKMGINALVFSFLLSNLIIFIFIGLKQLSLRPVSFDKSVLFEVLKISLPLTPKVFFGFLGAQFDKVMLGMMASLGGVGVYSVAQKMASIIFQFMTTLDRVFIPEIYRRLFARNGEITPSIGIYLVPFAYVSIFISLLFGLFAEEVFYIMMPASYSAGVDIVIVFTIYYASMFMGQVSGTQLIYAKKTYATTILMLIGIVLNVSLNIPMIIQWGTIGAAWATMISGVVVNIIGYRISQRYAPIDWEMNAMGWMYGMFIIAIVYALILRMDFFGFSYWLVFPGKMLFVGLYLYIGMKVKVITSDNMRLLYQEVMKFFVQKK